MEITRSSSPSRTPRTPVDSRPANTRTSPTAKRTQRPRLVVSSTSWASVQRLTPTMWSSGSSFMAILPLRLIRAKSDSLLRRTSPDWVANITSMPAQATSSSGNGRMVVIFSLCSSASRFTNALPRELGSPTGRRQTLSV